MKRLLLTGATGLVGQYLVRDLLLAGVKLVVMIRPTAAASARQRLSALLAHWERELESPLPRPVCLEGDLTKVDLGLKDDTRTWIAQNCSTVLHNAASLKFVGSDRSGEPWLSNLAGTRNLVEFCQRTGLRDFHHVSTAYVCGKRTGLIREDELDCAQTFRNDYEQSKFEAEKLVRMATCFDRVTIYRPAIIVGDFRTGYTSTYHGPYTYFRFVWMFCRHARRNGSSAVHEPMRFNLTGDEHRNLVPVDWVSAAMTRILLDSTLHGQTYHLAPETYPTARQIENALSAYFNYTGPVFAGPDALASGELNSLEKMFYSYVARYQMYWTEEPRFDTSRTRTALPGLPCPPVDADCLHRLLDYAVRENFGNAQYLTDDLDLVRSASKGSH